MRALETKREQLGLPSLTQNLCTYPPYDEEAFSVGSRKKP